MALYAIQLIRLVLSSLPVESAPNILNFVVVINQMINVITDLFISTCFVLLITFTWLRYRTNINLGAGLNEIVLR